MLNVRLSLDRRWIHYVSWLELVLGMMISAAAFHYVSVQVSKEAAARFEDECTDIKQRITMHLTNYSDLLFGLRAFMRHASNITRAEFHDYVADLDLPNHEPAVTTVNYAQHVEANDKEAFLQRIREDASADLGPSSKFSIAPPGERTSYHVMTVVEPRNANSDLLGMDLQAYRAGSAEVIAALRDSGDIVSGPSVMPGRDLYQWNLRLATYRRGMPTHTLAERRRAFSGSVGLRFSLSRLLQLIPEASMKRTRLRLYTLARLPGAGAALGATTQNLLVDSATLQPSRVENTEFHFGGDAPLSSISQLELGGRNLALHFEGRVRDFSTIYDRTLPFLVGALGLLSSALLYALTRSLLRSRENLESAVQVRTRELMRLNDRLSKERDQRIRLERAMLNAAESERARLGRELHDGLGQTLTATACLAQSLSQDLESKWKPGATQASAIEQHLSGAVEKARLLAQGLMPLASQVGSIAVALEQLARHAREAYHIDCRVICEPAQIIEDSRVAQQLYRIAQECIRNAVKHGHASCVTIELIVLDATPRLRMLVIDNGRGVDQEELQKKTGVGLRIMRQRARSIGMELTFPPPPDGGTIVRVD